MVGGQMKWFLNLSEETKITINFAAIGWFLGGSSTFDHVMVFVGLALLAIRIGFKWSPR